MKKKPENHLRHLIRRVAPGVTIQALEIADDESVRIVHDARQGIEQNAVDSVILAFKLGVKAGRRTATYEEAIQVWKDRANGADEGRSPGKGGRAWLAGEFRLAELEALCVVLRHEAGDAAEGLREHLADDDDG